MNGARNTIQIQDEYIQSMAPFTPKHSNYYTLVTKATKKAVKALMQEAGLDLNAAEQAVLDAHQVHALTL